MTEDEMVGWSHLLSGHEFEQAPGVGDGQGGLACCSPWGCKESHMIERLNGTERKANQALPLACCFPQVMVQTDEHCVAKTLILLDFPFFPLTYGLIMTRLGLMKESSNCFLFG